MGRRRGAELGAAARGQAWRPAEQPSAMADASDAARLLLKRKSLPDAPPAVVRVEIGDEAVALREAELDALGSCRPSSTPWGATGGHRELQVELNVERGAAAGATSEAEAMMEARRFTTLETAQPNISNWLNSCFIRTSRPQPRPGWSFMPKPNTPLEDRVNHGLWLRDILSSDGSIRSRAVQRHKPNSTSRFRFWIGSSRDGSVRQTANQTSFNLTAFVSMP